MSNYALGIDLGTSAIKLAVLNARGVAVAEACADIPMIALSPGQAEQGIGAWRHALGQAASDVRAALGEGEWARIGTIGLTGQLPSLVCLGQDGVWPNSITWADARADGWAEDFIDKTTKSMLYQRTGMPIDGRYLAPMFRFHHGAAPDDITMICSAKDWLCWALTGQCVTDPSTAAGYGVFDLHEQAWAEDLCAIWGLDPRLLPPVRPSGSVAGPLTPAGASLLGLAAGIAVYIGAADSVMSAFALGGGTPGTACIIMGSSTIIMGCVRTPMQDKAERYLVTPHVLPGIWGREMDLLSTGTGYRWLSALLEVPAGALDALAAESEPGARGVSCAPYFGGGEQGAIWDSTLSGVLHGLNLAHGRADIARAFLEAVQYEIRRCLDILAETCTVTQVIIAGKITEHHASLRMLADILGRPVVAVRMSSPAAYGAARLTFSLGHSENVPATEILPGEPGRYQAAYRRHLDLFPRIARPAAAGGTV